MRPKPRGTILAGFNPEALDEILRDNDMFRHNASSCPDFVTRVTALSMCLVRKVAVELCVFLQPREAAITLSVLRFWKYRVG